MNLIFEDVISEKTSYDKIKMETNNAMNLLFFSNTSDCISNKPKRMKYQMVTLDLKNKCLNAVIL